MDRILTSLELLSASNVLSLEGSPYPGRGMIVGYWNGLLVQVYWIMGRSFNSRNRVFVLGEDGVLFVEAADPSKVEDPRLIIYTAMREEMINNVRYCVVSNGSQTDVVADGIAEDHSMQASLKNKNVIYEPDSPNFTPRITAMCHFEHGKPIIEMSLLRKSPFSDECCRHLFEINGIGSGFGHCLTTYRGDNGDPLLPFRGEPYLLPLAGDANAIADFYWKKLNADNKVALAVKFIPEIGRSHTVIRNKYTQVQ